MIEGLDHGDAQLATREGIADQGEVRHCYVNASPLRRETNVSPGRPRPISSFDGNLSERLKATHQHVIRVSQRDEAIEFGPGNLKHLLLQFGGRSVGLLRRDDKA